MRTPPLVITYRAITVLLTVAVIALLAAGVTGHGPLSGLNWRTWSGGTGQ